MTQPTPHPADAMFEHLGAVVTARQTGNADIAGDLLNAMVTNGEEAFRVMLMLARMAATPAMVTRALADAAGVRTVGVVPEVELLNPDEADAMRMVAAMANREYPAAFAVAEDVLVRTASGVADDTGQFPVHRVIAALVDICAMDGPRITAVPASIGERFAKRDLN